ncbi:MAG TPA: phage protease [Candidatus Binataceae bacterium]|nr:phage protease [Candidatus Binataceae bacterium]
MHFKNTEHIERGGQLAVHGTAIEDAELSSSAPPQWVMLIPAGEFSGRDGRGPFQLTDTARVIAATEALGLTAGVPIDYDHATDFAAPKGRPAPAAGWIRELQERDGALWGRVDWTPHGATAITSREYRYISPVFQYSPDGAVTRLLRAGLTNNPNLYLTAISTRAAAVAAPHPEGGKAMDTLLQQLCEMLGLDDDASPEEALAAVRALSESAPGDDDEDDDEEGGRDGAQGDDCADDDDAGAAAMLAGADPARYVAVAQFQRVLGELNQLRAERAGERAQRAVDDAIRAGKLIPAQRQWAISYCQADFKGFAAFAARQPAAFAAGFESAAAALGAPPPPAAAAALTAVETAICAQLGLSPQDYLGRKRCGRGDFLRLNRGND